MRESFDKLTLIKKINDMPDDDSNIICLKKSELQSIMNFGMTELSRTIRSNNAEKFFESPAVDINRKLLLVVSEICEAQEELRDGNRPESIYTDNIERPYHAGASLKHFPRGVKLCGFSVEIADAIIRLLDICAAYNIEIDEVVKLKLEYNKTRPVKHGRKF